MSVTMTWAVLLACVTLASWAVWVGLGHASWSQWYMGAFPAAIAMGLIGFAIGRILEHPHDPHYAVKQQAILQAKQDSEPPTDSNNV